MDGSEWLANETTTNSSTLQPDREIFLTKSAEVRTVVAVTSALSMLGAFFVVLSYVCVKSIRTQARQILLNLSVMDFGSALTIIVGTLTDFDRFYVDRSGKHRTWSQPSALVNGLCEAQAFLHILFNLSSMLWTIALAVYMYMLVFHNWQQNVKYFLHFCYVLGYGIPLLLSVWFLEEGKLGYAPFDSSGWCTLKTIDPYTLARDYLAAVIGYDLWVYLAAGLTVIIYTAVFWRLKFELKDAIHMVGSKRYWKQALQFLDAKLLLIPVMFILVRIWTCVFSIMFVYMQVPPREVPSEVSQTLIYLVGIGDSGQGMVNGLLFVFCAGNVLRLLLNALTCYPVKASHCDSHPLVNDTESSPLLTNSSPGRMPKLINSSHMQQRSLSISQKMACSQKRSTLLDMRISPSLPLDD